jgi:hypothetical protein
MLPSITKNIQVVQVVEVVEVVVQLFGLSF